MKARIYKAVGLCLSILPPAGVTLAYFPLWFGEEKSTVSVLSILILMLCALPFHRVIRERLRSPAAWQMWLILWVGLSLFESICRGLRAVSCVAFFSNLLGAVFFRLAKRSERGARAGDGAGTEETDDGER